MSAWVKGSKINFCFSAGMPMPVSATVICTVCTSSLFSFTLTCSETSPFCVNLMALPTRLRTTCRSRRPSPVTHSGTSGAISQISSSALSSARKASVCSVSSRQFLRLKSTFSNSTLPASIFEKSRMSLMTVSSVLDERSMVSRYSRCSGLSSVSRASSVMPITPFSGVRIS